MSEVIEKIKQFYGAEIAEQLLTELNYPNERIQKVKNYVLNQLKFKIRK